MAWQSFKRPSRKTFGRFQAQVSCIAIASASAGAGTGAGASVSTRVFPEGHSLWVMGQKARQLATFSNGLHKKRGRWGQLQEVGAAPKFQMKSQRAKIVEHFFFLFFLFLTIPFASACASFVFNLCCAHLMFATATPTSIAKSRVVEEVGVVWESTVLPLVFLLSQNAWRNGFIGSGRRA